MPCRQCQEQGEARERCDYEQRGDREAGNDIGGGGKNFEPGDLAILLVRRAMGDADGEECKAEAYCRRS